MHDRTPGTATARTARRPLDGTLELRLPTTLLEDLRATAIANERSVSAEVRVAVAAHLRRQETATA